MIKKENENFVPSRKLFKKDSNGNVVEYDVIYDTSKLNELELTYWKQIFPQYGVLYLKSEPGIAKSSILKSIASKISVIDVKTKNVIYDSLGYIDLRLSMIDETDVGLFPHKIEKEGNTYLTHIVPKWAYLANSRPTLIHFEELNRASLQVRNAALQILLERNIGYEFSLNSNVFMASTGNLGDEDGTDVEEFDSALKGRLIHRRHKMNFSQWCEWFANKNIHPEIINFLENKPAEYYKKIKHETQKGDNTLDEVDAYASPRSWDMLSQYIEKNYGKNASSDKWIDDIELIAHTYVGLSALPFVRYIKDKLKISIWDIIDKFPELISQNVKFTRDKKSELINDLTKTSIKDLKENQIENIKQFLLILHPDEVSSYLLKLLDDEYNFIQNDEQKDNEENSFIISFLRDERFAQYHEKIDGFLRQGFDGELVDEDDNENNFFS